MGYQSSIFPAKEALDALLKAATWEGGPPDILWGQPTEGEDQTFDQIYQGDPDAPEDNYMVFGRGRLDEIYDLTLVVDVNRYGDDERDTERRAYQLLGGLLTVVHENPQLSGTVNRVEGWQMFPINAPGGPQLWRTQLLVRLQVAAYVFPT